ncbi:very short patch repair endonuclease [soil metagenome]
MVRVAPGLMLRYPTPTSPAAKRMAMGNRRRDTKAEVRVRRALHRRGLRFRVDHPVAVGLRRVVKVDIAFTRVRLAVFVDGCFWHGCAEHQQIPKSNREYWVAKFKTNAARDRLVDEAFAESRWTALRVWEHVDAEAAADQIEAEYRRLSSAQG